MKLKNILEGTGYRALSWDYDLEISRIVDDSRTVAEGDMFIAFRGYASDGHKYIDEAIKKGAKVILAEAAFKAPKGVIGVLVKDTRTALPAIADNFYGHPSNTLKLIGVTGTNGKTTITYVIESILKEVGEDPCVIGTINYRLGGKIIPAKNTTPGPLELQAIFSDMVRSRSRYAVMEVSSHALDQGRLGNISLDAAIFTNITPEHLDYHKTLEGYYRAKTKIFERLKKDGAAILNNDDPKVAVLKSALKNRVLTYGIKDKCDYSASGIRLSISGSEFTVNTPTGSFDAATCLVGRHNVSNILAAVAVSSALGVSAKTMKAGIEACTFVPGRMEPVDCGQEFKVFVDFAHTEDALRNVLGLLREVSRDKIITVFGCGGNRDTGKRPLMARAACELSDHVIITSDNPRFEEPEKIIKEIVGGVDGKFTNYSVCPDRRPAIEKALSLASKGSIVVIAGKGHENYQIVKDEVLPFDDREVVKEILK